jgi:hypothetical protein
LLFDHVRVWPVASHGAAQANVGVQGNSGGRRRMRQSTLLTDAVEKGLVIFDEQ